MSKAIASCCNGSSGMARGFRPSLIDAPKILIGTHSLPFRRTASFSLSHTNHARELRWSVRPVHRKRFRETFDAINLKFEEVFPRLFGGGRPEGEIGHSGFAVEPGFG